MGPGAVGRAMAALAAAALLASCSSAPEQKVTTPSRTTSTAPAASSYVALGDSFTAGPGLPDQKAGAGFCQRSGLNWPTLLAASRSTKDLADLSCSGATTSDLASTVSSPALGAGTNLVTVSIGGNDGSLFASLLGSCSLPGDTCSTFVDDRVPVVLDQTVTSVRSLVGAIRGKAPDARIVLVGYLRIMPDTGTCDTLGITTDNVAAVREAESELDAAEAKAAEESGVEYVSLRDVSRGHDACAGDQAWTNGRVVAGGDGISFHPRTAGMRAAADTVEAALAR